MSGCGSLKTRTKFIFIYLRNFYRGTFRNLRSLFRVYVHYPERISLTESIFGCAMDCYFHHRQNLFDKVEKLKLTKWYNTCKNLKTESIHSRLWPFWSLNMFHLDLSWKTLTVQGASASRYAHFEGQSASRAIHFLGKVSSSLKLLLGLVFFYTCSTQKNPGILTVRWQKKKTRPN